MKIIILTFFVILLFNGCSVIHTQLLSNDIAQPTPARVNGKNEEHAGYARFTSGDKQYRGCWKTTEAPEVVKYKLKYLYLTDSDLQISEMANAASYTEIESNKNKDYFVLHLTKENKKLASYLSINMVSDDEMTIGFYSTKDLSNENMKDYWNLKRDDCKTVIKELGGK